MEMAQALQKWYKAGGFSQPKSDPNLNPDSNPNPDCQVVFLGQSK